MSKLHHIAKSPCHELDLGNIQLEVACVSQMVEDSTQARTGERLCSTKTCAMKSRFVLLNLFRETGQAVRASAFGLSQRRLQHNMML